MVYRGIENIWSWAILVFTIKRAVVLQAKVYGVQPRINTAGAEPILQAS